MEIINYNDAWYEKLVSFLKVNWSEKHVIYNQELFNWQYKIRNTEESSSLLLVNNGMIVGFLGVIPSLYAVNQRYVNGAGLAMWIVDEKYRNSGIGILLLKEVEKNSLLTLTLGCNLQVAPMYQRMGYSYSPNLNRYVYPLKLEGYVSLLPKKIDNSVIYEWIQENLLTQSEMVEPNEFNDLKELENLYLNSIAKKFSLSQVRDALFWKWRYLENEGYSYIMFGDPTQEGLIVTRLESVYAPENPKLDDLKVLRVIEIIPSLNTVWNGYIDEKLIKLIKGVLIWAEGKGCVAADYQLSSNRLEHILLKVGFRLQNADYTPTECGIAGLFQPFRNLVNPINLVWKCNNDTENSIDINDTYLVKSDGDMDRPNIWPLPERGAKLE
ncbi:GNAT family N-acetyltransferase [Paenibacillus sp. FSL K6-4396]|uniref:GNAT family N-acetyltransferase n=1 Tax=unclassified Paenibacillus TaxID=185978 RepID=UPI0017829266|nr:GNAT family N-acetyltransferase [Paenibacillus sp. CFBP 13594]MBD8840706.1 GNAT family N-acetyltransferase [Paenibacillus sp. CFBP 13594]